MQRQREDPGAITESENYESSITQGSLVQGETIQEVAYADEPDSSDYMQTGNHRQFSGPSTAYGGMGDIQVPPV